MNLRFSIQMTGARRSAPRSSCAPALPENWIEQNEPASGKTYYANTVTHEVSTENEWIVY